MCGNCRIFLHFLLFPLLLSEPPVNEPNENKIINGLQSIYLVDVMANNKLNEKDQYFIRINHIQLSIPYYLHCNSLYQMSVSHQYQISQFNFKKKFLI